MPDALTRAFEQFGDNRRLMLILVGAGTLGVMWALVQWAMEPNMRSIFQQSVPVEEVGSMTQRLGEEGIAYELGPGGTTILVAENDLARATVALAGEGYAMGGQPGWELFDQVAWGMTDFTQRVNYRRALEGELGRTIGNMRGIDQAQVHLAIQKSSVLSERGSQTEASVVVAFRSNSRPENSTVQGIAALVAGAVEGLDKSNVTVLDDTGRLLSRMDSDFDTEGLTTRQLAIQQEYESYLEDKAHELVEPVVGGGNVNVRVSASLNFDRIGRTTETYDLDNQATLSQSRSEIVPGTEEQGASSTTVNSVFETPKSVETFNQSGAQLERLTVAVVVNERQVGVGDTATSEPRSTQELGQVEALVRNALGITDARGDAITVVNLPFDRESLIIEEPPEEGLDVMALVMAGIRPAVGLAGLILAFVMGLRLMTTIKAAVPVTPSARSLPAGGAEEGALPQGDGAAVAQLAPAAAGAVAAPNPAPKLELADPEITAKVVRAWMGEA